MFKFLAVCVVTILAAFPASAQSTGYTVAAARYDQMFAIGNLAETESAIGQIGASLQVAAGFLHMSNATIFAYEGLPISSENADWVLIQDVLVNDGYSVLVDDVAGTARISWN